MHPLSRIVMGLTVMLAVLGFLASYALFAVSDR